MNMLFSLPTSFTCRVLRAWALTNPMNDIISRLSSSLRPTRSSFAIVRRKQSAIVEVGEEGETIQAACSTPPNLLIYTRLGIGEHWQSHIDQLDGFATLYTISVLCKLSEI